MSSTTIKPTEITNFNRTDAELQTFWLFSMFVAGKNSDHAAKCLKEFLATGMTSWTPFELIEDFGEDLLIALQACMIGQYGRLEKGIRQSLKLDLRTASLEDLMNIHGVGGKTARFFVLHTRKDIEVAALDTHILAWLRDQGIEAPKSTPTNVKKYLELEKTFITLAKAEYPNMTIADIDLMLWAKQSGRI